MNFIRSLKLLKTIGASLGQTNSNIPIVCSWGTDMEKYMIDIHPDCSCNWSISYTYRNECSNILKNLA